ncbi:hypothetical protein BLS_005859 [Venturia inaequalis]|uniref:Uncharacterized protein n=1 Tax=Venturia inaequalis TaxID=5025 RepID=A0A8H3YPM0_VENIN|nr:hypothetical protein BLS_005859 [Venturia inaequalis]KAE9994722.1 hypothetical protein EG327_005168 [Venturia inaequalis]RDI79578.1 hypothetical protein Vi05172_g10509 [Venturia inaequalis]
MEPMPVPQEVEAMNMKRYFKDTVAQQMADMIAQVVEVNTTSVIEDTEAVTSDEPEGKLVDEGPLPEEEMPELSQALTLASLYIEPTVVHNPQNPDEHRRAVLIPNIHPDVHPPPDFVKNVKTGVFFRVFDGPTRHMKFRDPEGRPTLYAKDSALVVFQQAADAEEFARKYEAHGAIYLSGPTNPAH